MNTTGIHTDLYITHENAEVLAAITGALSGTDLDREKARAFSAGFAPTHDWLVNELFKHKHVTGFHFETGADEEHGYIVFHLLQDEWGDTGMVHFIDFLYALIPGIHAQAWGCAEEDAWEFFIKRENGRTIKQEHVAGEDPQMDARAIEYIYSWWHEDMPDEIEAGLLSEDYEDDDEDDVDDWDDEDDEDD